MYLTPGWCISIPLLLIAALTVWALLGSAKSPTFDIEHVEWDEDDWPYDWQKSGL
jgi:hypothetical protein